MSAVQAAPVEKPLQDAPHEVQVDAAGEVHVEPGALERFMRWSPREPDGSADWVAGSGAGAAARGVPVELRHCCPDAGDSGGRCHGQPLGACGCPPCRRGTRHYQRVRLGNVRRALVEAALPVHRKRYARRALAWFVRVSRAEVGRERVRVAALERERDDALMQAAAAAERAHGLEEEVRSAELRECEATDEVARLEKRLADAEFITTNGGRS